MQKNEQKKKLCGKKEAVQKKEKWSRFFCSAPFFAEQKKGCKKIGWKCIFYCSAVKKAEQKKSKAVWSGAKKDAGKKVQKNAETKKEQMCSGKKSPWH